MAQWYYAVEGQQRGPVEETALRGLYERGEIGPDTLVWTVGQDAWRPVRELFGPASRPAAAPSPAEPQREPFGVFACYGRAWRVLSANVGIVLAATLVLFLLMLVLAIPDSIGGGIEAIADQKDGSGKLGLMVVAIALRGFGLVLSLLLQPLLIGGYTVLLLALLRGQPGDIRLIFSCFRMPTGLHLVIGNLLYVVYLLACMIPLVLAVLGLVALGQATGIPTPVVVAGAVVAGLICLVPIVYLAVSYLIYVPALVDRELPGWEALRVSRQAIAPHWFAMLGMVLVGIGVALLGLLACCVGLLLAVPLIMLANVCAYDSLLGSAAPRGEGE